MNQMLDIMAWQIIEHLHNAVPTDLTISHREKVRGRVIKQELVKTVSALNTIGARCWLNTAQIEGLYEAFTIA